MNIKRYLTRAALALMIAAVWAVTAYAAERKGDEGNRYLIDLSSLVTDAQAAEIEPLLRSASDRANIDIAILTIDDISGKTSTQFADDAYEDLEYGRGPSHDGVMLLISIKERDWAITTEGFGITAITPEAQSYIMGIVRPLLSDGRYAQAFRTFAELCGEIAADARAGRAFTPPKDPFSYVGNALLALVIGLLIAAIRISSLRGDLKSVRPNEAAEDYVRSGSMNIRNSSDVFLFSNVVRTKIPKKSSSSGTHRSSSGRTHGGSSGKF